ncbi:MAG: GNAT family N-acetyltransferase [Anaerolineales bacterium]|nr:GNAT family N-acetyltransferase [Anaerolineales bacterium]
MVDYLFFPLTVEFAHQIATWRYEPPYDLYDIYPEHLKGLLYPAYRYHQMLDQEGSLVGFCCFGADACVPGGEYGQGEPEVLDIGVGLRPDLTGQGLGRSFVQAILNYGEHRFQPERFRVTVADFNLRSRKTFQNLGFQEVFHFTRELMEVPFTQFEKPISEDVL